MESLPFSLASLCFDAGLQLSKNFQIGAARFIQTEFPACNGMSLSADFVGELLLRHLKYLAERNNLFRSHNSSCIK